MATVYHVQIIARHKFNDVEYDELFSTLELAKEQMRANMLALQELEEEEWADSYSFKITPRTVY